MLVEGIPIMMERHPNFPFDTRKLIEICRQNDVSMVGVFGSVARGEATAHSDVDLLVRFSKRKSLLAHIALERQLSTALGREVDLLTEAALSPYLRERILGDLQVLYLATQTPSPQYPPETCAPRMTPARR